MLTTSTMPTTNVMSVSPFATTTPPPPPLVVPIDLTDLHHSPLASILDLEDLDPAQKPSDDPIRPATSSSGSMRFRPYNTRGRPKTMANKGKRRAESSPLSSVPPSPNPCTSPTPSVSRKGSPSPTPRAGPSSVRRQIAAVPLRIARPKNATRQNLQNLLGWDADEYKDFRVSQNFDYRKLNRADLYIGRNYPWL